MAYRIYLGFSTLIAGGLFFFAGAGIYRTQHVTIGYEEDYYGLGPQLGGAALMIAAVVTIGYGLREAIRREPKKRRPPVR